MPDDVPRRRITVRSALLGLVGGSVICALVPYNDQAMQNTHLVGNNLPLGAMVLALLFVVLVNGPLNRWRPRLALDGFELAVAFSLMLVMCAIPSAGMMRYLLPNVVAPWAFGVDNEAYRDVLSRLGVASWVFPSFEGRRPADWIGDPLAVSFVDRWNDPDRSPYGAWLVPFLSWGLFAAAWAWAMLCMTAIVLRQWRDREHLAFPLASVQLALLERPARGRWLNRVLSARSFWVAFSAVMLLHVNNGLADYFPKYVTPISRGYDFLGILNEPPWSHVEPDVRKTTIYFAMIGIAYFLSGPVAFGLWAVVLLMQVYRVAQGTTTGDPNIPGTWEQRNGAMLAMLVSILWLGRRHWAMVARHALGRRRTGDELTSGYLGYRSAAWGLVGGCAAMTLWLTAAGATLVGSLVVVAVLMVGYLLVTRLIAETGLIHGAMPISVRTPFEYAQVCAGVRPTLDTYYLASVVQGTHYDYRETLPVYASHGMVDVDETADPARRPARVGRQWLMLACLALGLAYTLSFWASLQTQYAHAVTLDIAQASPPDVYAVGQNPRGGVIDPVVTQDRDTFGQNYSRLGHLGVGFGVMALLSVLRLRFAWWPLHPAGFVIYGTYPSLKLWFSIFLGWLAKQLVLRLGTATFYERCKPFFLGLIFGELAAAGGWLAASHVLHLCGVPFRSVLVLPN